MFYTLGYRSLIQNAVLLPAPKLALSEKGNKRKQKQYVEEDAAKVAGNTEVANIMFIAAVRDVDLGARLP